MFLCTLWSPGVHPSRCADRADAGLLRFWHDNLPNDAMLSVSVTAARKCNRRHANPAAQAGRRTRRRAMRLAPALLTVCSMPPSPDWLSWEFWVANRDNIVPRQPFLFSSQR